MVLLMRKLDEKRMQKCWMCCWSALLILVGIGFVVLNHVTDTKCEIAGNLTRSCHQHHERTVLRIYTMVRVVIKHRNTTFGEMDVVPAFVDCGVVTNCNGSLCDVVGDLSTGSVWRCHLHLPRLYELIEGITTYSFIGWGLIVLGSVCGIYIIVAHLRDDRRRWTMPE